MCTGTVSASRRIYHADRRETDGTDHVFQRYQRDAGRTDRVSGKSLPEGKSGVQFSDEVECRSDISWVYADDLFKGASLQSASSPRSALIEVGAQTNTYEEAVNAMDPLAQLLDQVLTG